MLWLALGAAGAGVVAGVALAFSRSVEAEAVFEVAEAQVTHALPMGDAPTSANPMAPHPQALDGIPPYPEAAPRRLFNSTTMQGVPMLAAWFETSDSVDKVLSFYERAFTAEERRPVAHRYSSKLGYVAWLDELPREQQANAQAAAGVMHMVSATREGSRTVVLLSASRPDLAMASEPAVPEGVTLPPSATSPQVLQMGELGADRKVVYAKALGTSPAEVLTYFRSHLEASGWTAGPPSPGAKDTSLQARRRSTTLVVDVRQVGEHVPFMLTFHRQGPGE